MPQRDTLAMTRWKRHKKVALNNTLRIGRVLEQAKAQGQAFTLEAIAHISPLARRHVIVNGTYDFSPAHTHHAKEQLCV